MHSVGSACCVEGALEHTFSVLVSRMWCWAGEECQEEVGQRVKAKMGPVSLLMRGHQCTTVPVSLGDQNRLPLCSAPPVLRLVWLQGSCGNSSSRWPPGRKSLNRHRWRHGMLRPR